jgi:chromosome partitioning protein
MTKVISLLNQKGGVGKTTISTNLGVSLQQNNLRVLLVDSDPQGSLRDWNEANEGKLINVVGLDRETLAKDIEGVKNGYDIVIIDGAPQSSKLVAAAIKASDLVIIPVTPSPYDVWACSDLVEIIKARQEAVEGKPLCRFLISRTRKGTTLSTDILQALSGYEIPVLMNRTTHREIYAQTASNGFTVHFDLKAVDAINEITNLRNEILEVLQ